MIKEITVFENMINEKFFELSEEEKQLLEETIGRIPEKEALYDILPCLRMSIDCIKKGKGVKSDFMPIMIYHFNKTIENKKRLKWIKKYRL